MWNTFFYSNASITAFEAQQELEQNFIRGEREEDLEMSGHESHCLHTWKKMKRSDPQHIILTPPSADRPTFFYLWYMGSIVSILKHK